MKSNMKISIGRQIALIFRQLTIILNNRFEKYGIAAGQYPYYLIIAECPGINQLEVSRKLTVNKGTANKALKKLEEQGFIYTEIDENDRRLHCMYLTEKGRNILPEIRTELKSCTDIISSGIDEDKKAELMELLGVVMDNSVTEVERIKGGK